MSAVADARTSGYKRSGRPKEQERKNRIIKSTTVGSLENEDEITDRYTNFSDCIDLIQAITQESTVDFRSDTYSIFNVADREELVNAVRRARCDSRTVADIEFNIDRAIDTVIQIATRIIHPPTLYRGDNNNDLIIGAPSSALGPVQMPTGRSSSVTSVQCTQLFLEQIVKHNKLLYVPTQRGTTCVSDFLLTMFFDADYIRNKFYNIGTKSIDNGTAAGGAGMSVSSSSPLRSYFQGARAKWQGILASQGEHLERFLQQLSKLYDVSASEANIGRTGTATAIASAAVFERSKTKDIGGMGNLLRQLINKLDFFVDGVCYTNLATFLSDIFEKDELHIINGAVAYKNYILRYKKGRDGNIVIDPDNTSMDVITGFKPTGNTKRDADANPVNTLEQFSNVYTILFHLNIHPISTSNPDTRMHHAVGFILNDGVWYYVDNENNGIAIPVPTNYIAELFMKANDKTLFGETIDTRPFYEAINAYVIPGWDKCYIRRMVTFHISNEGIKEWNEVGKAAAAEMENKWKAVGMAIASASAAAVPVPLVTAKAIAATLEAEPNNSNAVDVGDVPLGDVPIGDVPRFHSTASRSLSDKDVAAIDRAKSLRLIATRAQTAVVELDATDTDAGTEAEAALITFAKDADAAATAAERSIENDGAQYIAHPSSGRVCSAEADAGAVTEAVEAVAKAKADGGRRRCRHRTQRRRSRRIAANKRRHRRTACHKKKLKS